MKKNKISDSPRILRMAGWIFAVASIAVFSIAGFSVAIQDLRQTYRLAQETASFLETQCEKYDNYAKGISAKSIQEILDRAEGLKKFIAPEQYSSSDFLSYFIRAEHLSGAIILDDTFSVVAQADLDEKDSASMWEHVIGRQSVRDILTYPGKKYVDEVTIDGTPYQFAVIANADADGLILCYASAQKPSRDIYGYSVEQILNGNNFHKNPIALVTGGEWILSSTDPELTGMGTEECQITRPGEIRWKKDALTRFSYKNSIWYGIHQVSGTYSLYVLYPSDEVFANRKSFFVIGFMAYLMVIVLILAVQRYFDRKNLDNTRKQLSIIRGISLSYASIFLYHMETKKMEAVKLSDGFRALFHGAKTADFVEAVCEKYLDPENREKVFELLHEETLEERLRGKPYIGKEIQIKTGQWYSLVLIPQEYDAEDHLKMVLAVIRDISHIKQAQELSFKDRLTGLHNRNYMEVKGRQFLREGKLPFSLIMADCNYLKRTNDTLGHEYGDKLLRKVAEIFQESAPENCEVIRIGGDEFLILGRECPREQAEEIVARIRERFAEESSETLPLSAAFGIHTTEEGEFSFEKAYYLADQAMYRDKKGTHR